MKSFKRKRGRSVLAPSDYPLATHFRGEYFVAIEPEEFRSDPLALRVLEKTHDDWLNEQSPVLQRILEMYATTDQEGKILRSISRGVPWSPDKYERYSTMDPEDIPRIACILCHLLHVLMDHAPSLFPSNLVLPESLHIVFYTGLKHTSRNDNPFIAEGEPAPLIKDLRKGDVITHMSTTIQSWTTDIDVAHGFAEAGGTVVVLRLHVAELSRIRGISMKQWGMSGEEEIILQPGLLFRVLRVVERYTTRNVNGIEEPPPPAVTLLICEWTGQACDREGIQDVWYKVVAGIMAHFPELFNERHGKLLQMCTKHKLLTEQGGMTSTLASSF